MNMDTCSLPADFEALEPYVTSWAIGSAAGRAARREASNTEELRAFYDAVAPRLADALIYLDSKQLAEQDTRDRRLMTMLPTSRRDHEHQSSPLPATPSP